MQGNVFSRPRVCDSNHRGVTVFVGLHVRGVDTAGRVFKIIFERAIVIHSEEDNERRDEEFHYEGAGEGVAVRGGGPTFANLQGFADGAAAEVPQRPIRGIDSFEQRLYLIIHYTSYYHGNNSPSQSENSRERLQEEVTDAGGGGTFLEDLLRFYGIVPEDFLDFTVRSLRLH